MSPSLVRVVLGVVAVAVFTACGGGGGDGGTGPQPTTVAVSSGNDQVGAAGTALAESLAVIVRDQGGTVLSGITVNWTIVSGAGNVSPTSSTTNASGIAKTRRTLGPNAGTQTTRATVTGLPPVNFDAVSQIQGAVNISNSTTGPLTDTVRATKAESLTVLVTDQNAVPVPGVNVTWASANGTVSPTSAPTNAQGLSKSRFTYGQTAGPQSATATVTGLVGSPVTINFTANAGAAFTIVKFAGDSVAGTAGGEVVHTVQARDSYGNPKAGITVNWAVESGGGSITPQSITGTNGNAPATRTLGTSGTQTAAATAAVPGPDSVTFTAAIAVTVAVANNSFTPTSRTINAGEFVSWEWQGTTSSHNVTFTATSGAPENIADRTSGSAFRQFNTGGVTFTYECTNHADLYGMRGSITVNP